MDKSDRNVRIRWLTPGEHGRAAPPQGPTYLATIRLDREPFLDDEWSVLLENIRPFSHGNADAVISFVAREAPDSMLESGVGFHLFEGRWPVAEGRVL